MANAKFDSKSFNPEAFRYLVDRVPNLTLVDKFERFSSFYLETGEITNEELDRLQDILNVGEPLGMNHNSRQRLKDCQSLKRVKVRTKRNPYYDYSSIKASE